MTPLPVQMEPAVENYGRCLSAHTDREMARLMREPNAGPKIFETARVACIDVRARSIASSDGALAALPAFSDRSRRKAFIAERFDGLDQMMRETFSGGMDPDKWDK